MQSSDFRRVMAEAATWMVRNRRLCSDLKCLSGLLAARLRYLALRNRTLAPGLEAAARRVDADAEAMGTL
ncbi:MAG: hypothetical protein H7841_02575 [Magnetospirillum sp. WYHS-4]